MRGGDDQRHVSSGGDRQRGVRHRGSRTDAAAAAAPPTPPAKRDGAGPDAPGARIVGTAWTWLAPAVAEAQVPELKTRTPEINAVIESRRARYARVAAAVDAGCLGENNQGLLEPRPGSGCPPDAATLAADENRDRLVLYRTLVAQNKMPPGDLARVQAGFARANRERAPAGAWVQDEAGGGNEVGTLTVGPTLSSGLTGSHRRARSGLERRSWGARASRRRAFSAGGRPVAALRCAGPLRFTARPCAVSTRAAARPSPAVLIVDDAGEVIVLCVNMLQSLGYAVKGANRPETGPRAGRQGTVRSHDRRLQDARASTAFEVFEQARALRPEMAVHAPHRSRHHRTSSRRPPRWGSTRSCSSPSPATSCAPPPSRR